MEFGGGEANRTSCGFAVILVRRLSEAAAYKPARLSISLRDFNSCVFECLSRSIVSIGLVRQDSGCDRVVALIARHSP